MPHTPRHPCAQPVCPQFAPPGRRYCKVHAALEYDRQRGTAAQRGYDWAWQRLADAYRLAIGNRCEVVTNGVRCPNPADNIHHLWPVRLRPALRLVWANLRGFCISHHRYAEHDTDTLGQPPEWCVSRKWEERHKRRS